MGNFGDYGGMGRFGLLLFLFVFLIATGITVAIFNPEVSYETTMGGGLPSDTADGDGIIDFIMSAPGMILSFFHFLVRGLIIDIPYVPGIVRAIIAFPIGGLLILVFLDYTLDIVNALSNAWRAITPWGG